MMLKVDSPDTVGTPNVTTSVDGYHKDIQNGIIPAAFLQILKWNEDKCIKHRVGSVPDYLWYYTFN